MRLAIFNRLSFFSFFLSTICFVMRATVPRLLANCSLPLSILRILIPVLQSTKLFLPLCAIVRDKGVRVFLLEGENGGGRQIYFEIARVCIGTRSSFGRLFLAKEVCVEVFLQRNFEIFVLSKICDLIIGETSFSPPDFSRSGVSPPVSFGGCKLTFITDASEARLSSIGCATTTTIASTVTFQRGGVPGKRGKRARTSLRFRESGSP